MRPLTDSHHSGRYTATAAQWETMLAELTGVDLFSGSETGRVDVADHTTPDHPCRVWQAGDVFVGYSTANKRWRELGRFQTVLTDRDWSPGGKIRRTGVLCPWLHLEDRQTGATIIRGAFHGPSGIQGGGGWSRKPADRDNVRAAKDMFANLSKQLVWLHRALDPDEVTVAADINAHIGRPEWERRVNGYLDGVPDMRVVVAGKPTHGDREIDVHMTTLPVRSATVAGRVDGFDHRRKNLRTRRHAPA